MRTRRNRRRIIHMAETLYISVVEERIASYESVDDSTQLVKECIKAAEVFHDTIFQEFGPEEEMTHDYE